MDMDLTHWADLLPADTTDPAARPITVTITVDPAADAPAAVTLATRAAALVAALRTPRTADGDPLADADTADLLALLRAVHRVAVALDETELRLVGLARDRHAPAPWRQLAGVLGTSHPALIERTQRAAARPGVIL